MQIVQTAKEIHRSDSGTGADIWNCHCCGQIHMKFGEVLITFSPSEFRQFVLQSAEVYAEGATFAIDGFDSAAETGTVVSFEHFGKDH